MKIISFNFHHGGGITVFNNGEYIILEFERIFKKRYSDIVSTNKEAFKVKIMEVFNILKSKYNLDLNYDICMFPIKLYGKNLEKINMMKSVIKELLICDDYRSYDHHYAHAHCGFYQSPFNKALIISFDASGNDGNFNMYIGEGQNITLLKKFNVSSFGRNYRKVAFSIKEISKINPDKSRKNQLSYPGKLMGLCAYGNMRPEWLFDFRKIYKQNRDDDDIYLNNSLQLLSRKSFIEGNTKNIEYSGQTSYDLAATNQHFFEEYFIELTSEYINEYNLPIIISGGCALNVLLNETLRKIYGNNIFIAPNPDDSGIAFGGLMIGHPNKNKVDITYSGCPILDLEILDDVLNNFEHEIVNIQNVANLLKKGNIIGVMQGESEVGPRALGNRSIICDPRFPNMKDKLNKIKNREWFRPFAPAVRYEDRNLYFEFEGESRFMSFAPIVREEYRTRFPAITHVDNTARVQTVRKEQHEFFYDIMTELDSIILNTSFNINGEPMVTRVIDAIYALENTSLDYIIINDYLIKSRRG